MGSGEQMTEILAGRLQADLVSPASGLFVTLANAESRGAGKGDLVGDTQSLVLVAGRDRHVATDGRGAGVAG